MLKKFFLFLLLMVMAVATTSAATWKMHNYYVSSLVQNVYDTGNKIYYVNGGRLYEFDKATSTTIALNRQNKLTGNQISRTYYDWENRLLFVAYLDNNIDIIDGDGNVFNVSNVKDALFNVRNYTLTDGVLTAYSSDVINDITFANGIAYVTVNYGFITIDEATKRILDNKDLSLKFNNTNINSVAVIDSTMLILTNINCYYGPVGSKDPFSEYTRQSGTFTSARMYPINETSVFVLGSSALYNYDFSGEEPVLTRLVNNAPTSVQKTPTGFIANFAGQSFYYTIDPTGKVATKASSVAGFATADPMGDGTVWINDANGLHMQGGEEIYKMNSLTTNEPYWLKYCAAMDRLYASNSARNKKNNTNGSTSAANVINTYDGVQWENATAYAAAGGAYEFVFDPFDPYTYVRASWNKGVHKVTRNNLVINYTKVNSPLGTNSYKPHPAFDKNGNMWIISSYGNSARPVSVLPRSKYLKTSVSMDDWFIPSGLLSLNTGEMQASRFVISKLNNVKIYSDCNNLTPSKGQGIIYAFDNDNEDPTVDTYRLAKISRFVDQNNKQIKWTMLLHFEEDNDGLIWVGYSGGLFKFDPNVVFDDTPRAIRPYAIKFDEGKGYLCEGYSVYDIGVTRDNKKWLATNNGVYYVSADGSEVYNHFTTENSDLPSDRVYSVECDTINDRVYIFTDNGFAEYLVNGDAAAVNFNETYAFPNPVEPDFTGMVKIAKLMENSYVTITDRNGEVVAQIGPVMGSALWDCSGADGNRVPTGVYNVYAAQGGQPSTEGTPLTTIMIIR